MPIDPYGILVGRALNGETEREDPLSPHYQVRVEAKEVHFRVPINVKSKRGSGIGAQLLYRVEEPFAHPILAHLDSLSVGFHPLRKAPDTPALDYIRGNLLDRLKLVRVPFNLPGPNNDLNDLLDRLIRKAIRDPEARVFVWGEVFASGQGLHNVHMNQGNKRDGPFGDDNGVFQDGALMLHFSAAQQWVAVFLAFQTQVWHTDDATGHPVAGIGDLGPGDAPGAAEPDGRVRIVAARLKPPGGEGGLETVTLLNTWREPVNLGGWAVADRGKNREALSGIMEPGATAVITLRATANPGNRGGLLTLVDHRGLKVDGVAYTAAQAVREGETIVF